MVIINKGRSIIEGEVADLLNSGELVVVLGIDEAQKAADVLKSTYPEMKSSVLGKNELELVTTRLEVPKINTLLTQHAFAIHSIEPKRKLEDYFMKIIAE
jgi:ABC-2 type transport system ATP-binding protein